VQYRSLKYLGIAVLMIAYGCSLTPEQKHAMAIGAGSGAVIGGAIGCGTGGAVWRGEAKGFEIGCPTGVVGGAMLGTLAGYFLAPHHAPTPPPPAAQPPAPPPPPPASPAPHEKIILRGVHFAFNSAVLRDADKPVLDEAVATLKANPGVKIAVNGYCDAIGSFAYNLRLSQRRADAVATYLEQQGIPADRLVAQGFGKTHFVASNATAEGRAQNRRVELVPADQ
jgi:outer membrane protein OmpA-like peptidoglycan-associated protein